jgi:hypothetical protein
MFVGLGLSGVVPVIHGLKIYGYQGLEERMGLSLVVLHGLLYIFGAFLYAVSRLQYRQSAVAHSQIGEMAGEVIPPNVRHLGELSPTVPYMCPPCRGDTSLRLVESV